MPTKYETPRGAAATNAKRKYNEKTYDRIYPMVQKGKKALYQKAAEAGGFGSLNEQRRVQSGIHGRTRKGIKRAAGIAPAVLLFLALFSRVIYISAFRVLDQAESFGNT